MLWKSIELGRGYSAPIISGDRIYLTGDVENELRIFALDLRGQLIWQATNGAAWLGPFPGARACCAFSEGRLYHLNAHGRVACLEAATGKTRWAVDVLERFGGKTPTWGLSECLLVDGPRVWVTPGGTRALMAALDKRTGETLWTTEPLRLGPTQDPAQQRLLEPNGEVDSASYASPILIALDGHRQIVRSSLRHAVGVDADNGRLLWTRPMPTSYSVIAATPLLVGDAVLFTAPDTDAEKLYRIAYTNNQAHVETVWTTTLDTCHGCQVYVGGSIFGSWYRRSKGWACLDPASGKVRYQMKELAMGSILYADERLYCLSQEGEMALLKPTETAFTVMGRFRMVSEKASDAWTHPVILDRRLYLRFHETLFCYDVAEPAS